MEQLSLFSALPDSKVCCALCLHVNNIADDENDCYLLVNDDLGRCFRDRSSLRPSRGVFNNQYNFFEYNGVIS